MSKFSFVGLAMMTTVAPVMVVLGSSPAHADAPNLGDSCSVDGAKTTAADGTVLQCMHPAHGAPLVWIGITQPTR
jgi:hypothetical protein